MKETVDHFAIPYEDWSASLRIVEKENERLDDVYVEILIDHMKEAEHVGQLRLLKSEDYHFLVEILGRLCEVLERPYVEGILASLDSAELATSDGELINDQ